MGIEVDCGRSMGFTLATTAARAAADFMHPFAGLLAEAAGRAA